MPGFLRPSSLILALVTIFQFLIPAVLSLPQPVERTTGLQYGNDNNGNGYWWQEIEDTSVETVTAASMKAEAKADYEAMVKAAKAKDVPTTQIPAVYAVFFVPGHGKIGASTIWTRQPMTQSEQTCKVVQDANHRYFGNCAEMNAGAIAVNIQWATMGQENGKNKIKLPAGSSISAYGIIDKKTQATGWMHPCSASEWPGCSDYLELDKVNIYSRGLELAKDAAVIPASS